MAYVAIECENGIPIWWHEDYPSDEALANAHLIAAAPDLLAACEMAAELFELDMAEGCTDRRGPWEQLAAALAKAKGGAI